MKRDKFPIIPGYHLENILGRGATGIVFRATQLSVRREVALKVLRPELVGTSKAVERLQREARNTARLHHPNIISAIDMGEISGRWWYAMELVGGPTLAQRISKQGRLTEREALRLFTPLAAGLQHLHEQGIVHRDVKPSNIVLEEGGRALLIDLGLAFSEEDPSITRTGGTLGTPHYISPEQARDPSNVDVRSDIWSLGATMYHAVCGEPPFNGDSVAEIMSRVLYSRIPDPQQRATHLSRGYALVLRKCMSRDPEYRYQNPDELREDLERLRERRAPTVSRKKLDPLLREGRSRWHVPLALGAVVLLGATIWAAAAKPWEDKGVLVDVAVLSEWPELEEFAQLGEPESPELGARYYELAEISKSVPTRFRQRANGLRRPLEDRIERELTAYRRDLDRDLTAMIARNEFSSARALLAHGRARGLENLIGFRLENLPELRQLEFGNWIQNRTQRLDEAVESREIRFRALAELHLENTRRDVRNHQERHRWEQARVLLGENFDAWLAASGADGTGLSEVRTAELVSAVELQRNMLRQRFENSWYDTDATLKRFVKERARLLEQAVAAREVGDPRERLEAEFERELKKLGLRREAMPEGLSRYGLEELGQQSTLLAEQAARLARDDARELLRELQAENEAAWRFRDYASIERDLERRIAASNQSAVREALSQVLGEAKRLSEFLDRASAGVLARDGGEYSIALSGGRIQITGSVNSGLDPLERGFSVVAERTYAFQFVGPVEKPRIKVSTRDVRGFASAGGDPAKIADPELRFATALFLYREGDPREALVVLSSGDLPRDLLVDDLDDRIHSAIARDSEGDERDRATARHHLETLRREWEAPHDRKRLQDKCHELTTELSRFLTAEELNEVRAIATALRSLSQERSTLEDFKRLFGPHELEFVGPNLVRMDFRFDESDVGAWKLGHWRRSAFGWECPAGIATIVGNPGPNLILRKPLDVSASVLELELELEQLAPSNVLAVSAVGFHVVFTGGDTPRFLVHSGSVEEANKLAAAGEGRRFKGLERDKRYSMRFEFNQASGDVKVWIDGEKLDRRKDMRGSPLGRAMSNSITVSSVEPVRLISATVQAWRE